MQAIPHDRCKYVCMHVTSMLKSKCSGLCFYITYKTWFLIVVSMKVSKVGTYKDILLEMYKSTLIVCGSEMLMVLLLMLFFVQRIYDIKMNKNFCELLVSSLMLFSGLVSKRRRRLLYLYIIIVFLCKIVFIFFHYLSKLIR